MHLILTLKASLALLTFTLPAPGHYWLFSREPGSHTTRVEASGYAAKACNVAVSCRCVSGARVYWVRFDKTVDSGSERQYTRN